MQFLLKRMQIKQSQIASRYEYTQIDQALSSQVFDRPNTRTKVARTAWNATHNSIITSHETLSSYTRIGYGFVFQILI